MEKYGNIVQGSHHIPSPPWPQPSPAFWPRPTFEWRQPLPSTAALHDTLSHRGPQLRPDPFVKEQSLGGGPATDLSFKMIKVVLGTTHSRIVIQCDSMWFRLVNIDTVHLKWIAFDRSCAPLLFHLVAASANCPISCCQNLSISFHHDLESTALWFPAGLFKRSKSKCWCVSASGLVLKSYEKLTAMPRPPSPEVT